MPKRVNYYFKKMPNKKNWAKASYHLPKYHKNHEISTTLNV